jgi:hypothetical protein
MARKTLLTEGEIRQFMKLANLGPLGNEKIQEMGGMPYNRDEEEAMGDELSDMDSEADREGDEIDDLEGDLDVADDEIADDDMDMSGIGDDEKQDMMADVVQAVADALGISDQVSIEAGSEGGEDLDALAVDDEEIAGVDAMAMEPEMGDMGGEEEVAFDDEEEVEDPMMEKRQKYGGNKGDIPDDDRKKKGHYGRGQKRKETAEEEGEINKESVELSEEDDIVAEVAKRVAARLQQDNQRDAMVEKLAERIMKRLTK